MYSLKLTVTALLVISICKNSFAAKLMDGTQKNEKTSTESASTSLTGTLKEGTAQEFIENELEACKSILLEGFYVEDTEAMLNYTNLYERLSPSLIDAQFEPPEDNIHETAEAKKYREFQNLIYNQCYTYIFENTHIDFNLHDNYPQKFCHDMAEKEFPKLRSDLKSTVTTVDQLAQKCKDLLHGILQIKDPEKATTEIAFRQMNIHLSIYHLTYEDITGYKVDDDSVDKQLEAAKQREQDEKKKKKDEDERLREEEEIKEEEELKEEEEIKEEEELKEEEEIKEEEKPASEVNNDSTDDELNTEWKQNRHLKQQRIDYEYYIQMFLVPYFFYFLDLLKKYDKNAFPNIASFCNPTGINLLNTYGIRVPKIKPPRKENKFAMKIKPVEEALKHELVANKKS